MLGVGACSPGAEPSGPAGAAGLFAELPSLESPLESSARSRGSRSRRSSWVSWVTRHMLGSWTIRTGRGPVLCGSRYAVENSTAGFLAGLIAGAPVSPLPGEAPGVSVKKALGGGPIMLDLGWRFLQLSSWYWTAV